MEQNWINGIIAKAQSTNQSAELKAIVLQDVLEDGTYNGHLLTDAKKKALDDEITKHKLTP